MPARAQDGGDPWQTLLNGQARYYTWSTSRAGAAGDKGAQFSTPIGGTLVGKPSDDLKVEVLARSSYIYAKQTTGGRTGEYSGLTDSTLGLTFTYYGWNGIQPFLSTNINVPTGRSNLQGSANRAKGDADVVPNPAFGEGWNFAPTIGANIPITPDLIGTLSAGYTNRGTFNREATADPVPGSAGITRLDPGDVLTATAAIGYRGERLSLKGSASASWETVTTLGGQDFYQAGNRYVFLAAAGYAWTDSLSSRLQGTFSHFEKNNVRLAGTPALVREAFNSNSEVIKVNFDTTYSFGAFGIGPTAGWIYRDKNSWDPTTFQFLPAKTSWSAGLSGRYRASDSAQVTASAQRIWVDEDGSPNKVLPAFPFIAPGSAKAHTDAWQFSVGGSIKF